MRQALVALITAAGLALFVPALASAPAASDTPITAPPTVAATSWTAGSMPGVGASTSNGPVAVSCTSAAFCEAVGFQGPQASFQTLAQIWNGTSWTVQTTPTAPTGTVTNELVSVSCVGTSFCMAVGTSTLTTAGNPPRTLAEMWNGAAWTVVTIPNPMGSTAVDLSAVSCTSPTFCMAAGSAGEDDTALTETWNGTAWSLGTIAPLPTGYTEAQLSGITCGSPTWCVTVGRGMAMGGAEVTLAEQWNGVAWTVTPTPNVAAGSTWSQLSAISCAGPSFCMASGLSIPNPTTNPWATLIETWNGATWSITPSPNVTSASFNNLKSIDCRSTTLCTAVGAAGPTIATEQTMTLNWNGVMWTLGSAPTSAAAQTVLESISCITDWQCVAVGLSATSPTVTQPFVIWASIARSGYRFVATDGGVFAFGTGAPFLGSTGDLVLNKPIVGIGIAPAGDGYYLVASDGGIFTFGSALFYGSTGNIALNKPIVGMAVTPDGAGYWLVATDGGIFSFGDAQFYGSTGALTLNKPIVGMAETPDGKGYFLVASDGGIFSFGDAQFQGSTGSLVLNKPIVGMSVALSGGYYLVATDGGIFSFGVPFQGSTGAIVLNKPIVGMTTVARGYYLGASDGGVFAFPTTAGGPPFLGSTGSIKLNKPIVGIAS